MSEEETKAMNDRMAAVSLTQSSIKFRIKNRHLDASKNVIIHGHRFRISQ